MRRVSISALFILPVLIFFIGCSGPRYGDFFLHDDDGTPKPKVIFLPVAKFDTETEDLANYLDAAIPRVAMDHGTLFFYSREEVERALAKDNSVTLKKDLIPLGKCFRPADFVVEVEVITNGIGPYSRDLNNCFIPFPSSKNRIARSMKLRLKVVDIRCEIPRIILYEMIDRSQVLPWNNPRESQSFSIYERVSEQVVCRIEEVIWCAK